MLVADKSFLESEKYYPKLLDKCKLEFFAVVLIIIMILAYLFIQCNGEF